MKLRLALLLALFAGATAFAQTPVLPQISITRVDDPSNPKYTFGAAQCNDTVTLQWVNTLTISLTNQCAQNPLKLWASPGDSCPTAPAATDTIYPSIPNLTLSSVRQGSFSVKISELPAFKPTASADGGTVLSCNSTMPFTQDHVICGSVDYATFSGICSTASTLAATPLQLIFDTQPPTAPVMTSATPQDQGVRATFTVDSDTTTVIMEVTEYVDDGGIVGDFREIAQTASTNAFIHGGGLTDNVAYLVRLRSVDGAGNVSDPSDAQTVTPILTEGFWGFYKKAGGTDPGGGCSVGEGLMPLLLAAFALRRARQQGRSQS
jgi:hypothetical protein